MAQSKEQNKAPKTGLKEMQILFKPGNKIKNKISNMWKKKMHIYEPPDKEFKITVKDAQ